MKILLAVLLIVVVLFAVVRYLELTGIFYPSRDLPVTPEAYGLAYEDLNITTADGVRIHGWWIPNPAAKSVVLYIHGNGGNIAGRLTKLKALYDLGLHVMIFDYRGYGRSEGKPSEAGVYKDTEAAYDVLIAKGFKPEQIVGYGASLGGAVLIHTAVGRPFGALIIDSSFTSAADMAKRIYPYLPTIFMSVKMNSIDLVEDLKMPKLFIHSPDDEVVPFEIGRRLYDAAPEPKRFLEVIGGHNNNYIDSGDIFWGGIRKFLAEQGLI